MPPPPPVETAGPDSRPYHGFAPPPVPTTTAPEMAWEIRYNSTWSMSENFMGRNGPLTPPRKPWRVGDLEGFFMKDSGFQLTGVMKSLPGSSHHNHGVFFRGKWVGGSPRFVCFLCIFRAKFPPWLWEERVWPPPRKGTLFLLVDPFVSPLAFGYESRLRVGWQTP